MKENKMQKLFDDMLTIEEFGNLLNLEEELDKVSTTPSDEQIKEENKINKRRSTISFLESKHTLKKEKYYKNIGMIYFTDKRVKKHFNSIYQKDKETFLNSNYYHCMMYKKQNGLL